MVILGFMLNYMLRVNLTIAIVSMVIPSNSSGQHFNKSALENECVSRATMTNDPTPMTPIVAGNTVNETNNGTTFVTAFPQWHSVR